MPAGSTNANKGDFFKLWFASDLADPILGGPGQTTYYFFQGVRAVAWVNGLAVAGLL